MKILYAVLLASLVLAAPQAANAQGAGVCNRQADEIASKVQGDAQAWIDAIDHSLPQDEQDALKLLFSRNRDRSLQVVDKQKEECTAQFKDMQNMMDAVVAFYTGGLSKILAPRMTHVDVSEILAGYPLGGPNALIPKFREDVLRGDNGTIANIVRDPWKCLTFQRKC
ncbi:hypothetical protein JJL56_26490 [Azospirillum sp. YIM DDC1]|uniref:Uncharacterized protein n=1 Tax=Azospirillum aestuarii TaxID=2802052 RepID=A0ABS1I6X0_9PROT|nr:hypothetical protein [Azospirillum aestuarii]MBK4722408.1 hypothetical protein [Azospirillum aestuarii]